jgi:toxin CcdB
MPQFAVYLNKNLRSSAFFPMLVDVQSELLEDLESRVVVPLARATAFTGFPLRLVMPTIEIEGATYAVMTPQLAGVSRKDLGPLTTSVAGHARAIATALDLLLRGF